MLKIKDKAEELGVSIATLRRWHKKGLLCPDFITYGGHRRYKKQTSLEKRQVIGYSRVSSSDQKEDLARQSVIIQQSCVDNVIQDIGSGLNFNKKGFKSLLSLIFSGKVKEIKVVEKDRLLRFGFPLFERLCSHFDVKITVLRQKESLSFENQLVQDLISIITVFSAKLYGKRSHANKKAMVPL
jgi:predicted site-specific integrase-resolvase